MMAVTSWLDIACPICEAPQSKPCTTPSGAPLPHPHTARVKATEHAPTAVAEPEPDRHPLFGYTANGEIPHLVSSADPNRSVCGYKLTWVPDVQPVNPTPCKTCARLVGTFGAAYQAPPSEGVCPVCSATDRLKGGRLVSHNTLVMTKTGVKRSDNECPGAGELPDGDA